MYLYNTLSNRIYRNLRMCQNFDICSVIYQNFSLNVRIIKRTDVNINIDMHVNEIELQNRDLQLLYRERLHFGKLPR